MRIIVNIIFISSPVTNGKSVNELLGFVKRVGSVPNIPLNISKAARAPFAEASVVYDVPSKDEVEFTVIFPTPPILFDKSFDIFAKADGKLFTIFPHDNTAFL